MSVARPSDTALTISVKYEGCVAPPRADEPTITAGRRQGENKEEAARRHADEAGDAACFGQGVAGPVLFGGELSRVGRPRRWRTNCVLYS